ncbi:hypothetical protein [Anaerobacillus sp. CMMVII]|uniref:hypothetical protein n=1 Tax=Anaerobacillus sp. CMMVII TaxID=2755588 RepID=UPI0021B78105|nr:hypothetical protein [Anaerobacillus sp. CMMVII]
MTISLYVSTWEETPPVGAIAYKYHLEARDNQTVLSIEIGDFALLKKGQMYFDASIEFAESSKKVIKTLAESL